MTKLNYIAGVACVVKLMFEMWMDFSFWNCNLIFEFESFTYNWKLKFPHDNNEIPRRIFPKLKHRNIPNEMPSKKKKHPNENKNRFVVLFYERQSHQSNFFLSEICPRPLPERNKTI